ncbi:MAG: hypothetical protein HZA81_01900 [Candidatus Taylorbacteria bacterium]|nr:hypothetical protein [Candidatus Taylorbacteria bacterium]
MINFFDRIAFRLIATIIIMQTIVLSVAGYYYVDRFSEDIDARVESQISVPGRLMNQGLLNFEAFSKKETMKQIVGEDLAEAMIFGFDETVYYSADPEDLGKNAGDLGRIDLSHFTGGSEEVVAHGVDAEGDYIASITPIYSVAGKAPFLFVYVKIRTDFITEQKAVLRNIFFAGFLVTAGVTTFILIFVLQRILLSNVDKLRKAAGMVAKGSLGQDALDALPRAKNEFGLLSKSFEQMIIEMKRSREGLEEEVAKRTKELQSSQEEIVLKYDELKGLNTELERVNKLMVGRELRMVELKNKIRELEEGSGKGPSSPQA